MRSGWPLSIRLVPVDWFALARSAEIAAGRARGVGQVGRDLVSSSARPAVSKRAQSQLDRPPWSRFDPIRAESFISFIWPPPSVCLLHNSPPATLVAQQPVLTLRGCRKRPAAATWRRSGAISIRVVVIGAAQNNATNATFSPSPATGEQFGHQLDPQLHIYDDLDNAGSASATNFQLAANKEIDPQRVTVESVIGRGKFEAGGAPARTCQFRAPA